MLKITQIITRTKILKFLKENSTNNTNLKERILFWEPGGMTYYLNLFAPVAIGLKLRGIESKFILFNKKIEANINLTINNHLDDKDWARVCQRFEIDNKSEAWAFGLPHQRLGEYITNDVYPKFQEISDTVPIKDIKAYRYKNINVGRHVHDSVYRYFQGLPSYNSDLYEKMLRKYFYSSLVVAESCLNVIDKYKPTHILMSHGIYVEYGIAREIARKKNIPVTRLFVGYLQRHIYLKSITKEDPSLMPISDKYWRRFESRKLTSKDEKLLKKYMYDRYTHTEDIEWGLSPIKLLSNKQMVHRRLGITNRNPIWCLFTHINWDAVFPVDYKMIFKNVDLWVLETIAQMINLPGVNWIIKIHPAEAKYNTYHMENMIYAKFPQLPKHIHIISPREKLNTMDIFNIIDGGITVAGTAGIELSMLGKPVIIAGHAYYGSKGFTIDTYNRKDYFDHLNKVTKLKLAQEQILIAKKYAFYYFVKKQIQLEMMKYHPKGFGPFNVKKLEWLIPGNNPTIDMICKRIIDGGDFVIK